MRSAEEILSLAEQIKSVPHLPLDVEVDIEGLLTELSVAREFLTPWAPDPSSPVRDSTQKRFYEAWELCGAIDYFHDARDGARAVRRGKNQIQVKQLENGLDETVVTEMGQRMPRTVRQILELGDFPGRCRISLLKSGQDLVWHSHYRINEMEDGYASHFKGSVTHYNTPEYVHPIVHIPIITNDKVDFCVKLDEDDPLMISRNYRVGEAILFNSWYNHNVFNRGENDRLHLMCHMHLADDKFFELVTRSLKKYRGPFLIE